jgi:hypothetical protein
VNAPTAWQTLAALADVAAGDDFANRLAMYDALSVIGHAAGLYEEALHATSTAAALRGAETQELNFRQRIADRAKGARP